MSQTILCLRRIHRYGRNGGLAKHVYGCARGIGAVAEQLRFSGCAAVHRPAFYRSAFEMWRPRLFVRRSQVRLRPTPCQGDCAAGSSCARADGVKAKNGTVRNLRRGRKEITVSLGGGANQSVFHRSIFGMQLQMLFARHSRGRRRPTRSNFEDRAACLWLARADIDAASCEVKAPCFP